MELLARGEGRVEIFLCGGDHVAFRGDRGVYRGGMQKSDHQLIYNGGE